jgi:hypothetical protein
VVQESQCGLPSSGCVWAIVQGDGAVVCQICALLLLVLRLCVLKHIAEHARGECKGDWVAVKLLAVSEGEAHEALTAQRPGQ